MATADVQTACEEYFATLNPLSKRLWQERENVRKSCGQQWDQLTTTERELLFQRHLIDETVQEKYESLPKTEVPEVFPKTKINCGEKIVVDFENEDGWTWRDEHSGPFSWMTKSQQDLTLDDLDDLENDKGGKQSRGRSHSPERDAGAARPAWDARYAATDKTKNVEAASTADEIFQKFGIAFSFGKEDGDEGGSGESPEIALSEEVESPREESKLLPGHAELAGEREDFTMGAMDFDGFDPPAVSDEYYSGLGARRQEEAVIETERASSVDLSSSQESGVLGSSSRQLLGKASGGRSRLSSRSDRSEPERALIGEDVSDGYGVAAAAAAPERVGQVSPVFVPETSLESSSDQAYTPSPFDFLPVNSVIRARAADSALPLDATTARDVTTINDDVSDDRIVRHVDDLILDDSPALGIQLAGDFPCGAAEKTSTDADLEVSKTGFDFLDNW